MQNKAILVTDKVQRKRDLAKQWYVDNRQHLHKSHANSYGFHSMPYNEVIDKGGFKDAFVDTLIALGHNHISAVLVLHTWLHGFDGHFANINQNGHPKEQYEKYYKKKEIDNE